MRILVMTTAALLVGTPLVAQQHGHQRGDDRQGHAMGMMAGHCMEMMGGAPPAMLLQHRQQLGLSSDQVQRLEAIQARTQGGAHMSAVMAAHREAAEIVKAERPDFAAYEAKLRDASAHMIQAHVAMARAAVEARQVLTAEQRERLASMDHGMMGGTMGHGRMQGEGHAMAGMMGCPMMGAMHGQGDEGQGHHNH